MILDGLKKTPMLEQFVSIKKEYPDTLLFYRMGDFYELFFRDAQIASKELNIVLTSRDKKKENAVPMCGVPARAVTTYVSRLLEKGYKVAICDQVEDPATAKGIVKREVVRVITPGMVLDDDLLNEKTNNYLVCVDTRKEEYAISSMDVSTANFRITSSHKIDAILDEIRRLTPKEILLSKSQENTSLHEAILQCYKHALITFLEPLSFHEKTTRKILLHQFSTLTLEAFGCEHSPIQISVAGALLQYVKNTQKQDLIHITNLEAYSLEKCLLIDDNTCRNLELLSNIQTGSSEGTLISILDETYTAMGARLFRRWIRYPLYHVDAIKDRLQAVEEAFSCPNERVEVRKILKEIADIERLTTKIALNRCTPRDLLGLKDSLYQIPLLTKSLFCCTSPFLQFSGDLQKLTKITTLIEEAISPDAPTTLQEGHVIRPEYNSEIAHFLSLSVDAKSNLARIEQREREITGISSLKVGFNRVFGYYIEISKGQVEKAPMYYIRKQTLANAERYITEDLKKFENLVMTADEKRIALEQTIFENIRQQVASSVSFLQEIASFVATVDCIFSLAQVADRQNYVRPHLNQEGSLQLIAARHPVIEYMLPPGTFVPNDILLNMHDQQILIITGPNMAGKSTILRQTALCVLMAHMGSFVPAAYANVPLTDRIFTRVGALDNLSQGQSTFMVEMQETAYILRNTTPDSLILMDEIGRGTSTFDGFSIAWAITEYLHDLHQKGVKTLFATHYHELIWIEHIRSRVKNFQVAVKEEGEDVVFLHTLLPGGADRSYGIYVARLAGLPNPIIRRAQKILSRVEASNSLKIGKSKLCQNIKTSSIVQKGLPLENSSTIDPSFESQQKIFSELGEIDTTQLTPLAALTKIHEWQSQIKKK